MISIKNVSTMNFENAIRGMRNPLNSWDRSDSDYCWHMDTDCPNCTYDYACIHHYMEHDGGYILGENDLKLAKNLVKAGSDERKFLRQIFVSMDITAPLYWWKEMDTYKVATVSNSTSTMHRLTEKSFTKEDFSLENTEYICGAFVDQLIYQCENLRKEYIDTNNKKYWYALIQILPESFNQTRTWTANYETLRNIYHSRKNHKLDEWKKFCEFIKTFPYAEELICE